ncbi:hypothetical protein, partial [Turicimonas muris]|uniref:hypothetical protein n=1 Tax=Turicimonas muris TaxID=1796652 RepID=UPI0024956C3B
EKGEVLTRKTSNFATSPLLIGPHYFGDYVIEYVSETHKYHNANGICLIAEAAIDLRGTS